MAGKLNLNPAWPFWATFKAPPPPALPVTQETPSPGGATCGGFAPAEIFTTDPIPFDKEQFFLMLGPAGWRKLKLGAIQQSADQPTTVSPTPGGATCAGFGPVAQVTTTINGAVVSGSTGETASADVIQGGASCAGFGPTATTNTVINGALVSGQSGSSAATTLTQGGASEGGSGPQGAASSAAGGAIAQGTTGETAATSVTQGGAVVGGFPPNPQFATQELPSQKIQQFFLFGPAGLRKIIVGRFKQPLPPVETPVSGGATTGGFGPTALMFDSLNGGAVLGGHINQLTSNTTTNIPQGGAIAQGTTGETATTPATIQGAPAQGTTGETAATNLVQGGATVSGFAPGEAITAPPTATPIKFVMFMLAGPMGIRKLRKFRVIPVVEPPGLVPIGGAAAGGFGPLAQTSTVIGGAIDSGRGPTATAAGNAGGAVLGGQTPVVAAIPVRGGATVAGQLIITAAQVAVGIIPSRGRTPTEQVAAIVLTTRPRGTITRSPSARGVISKAPPTGEISSFGNTKGRIVQ